MSSINDDEFERAVIVHDIRGPLTNLKGFCNEIEDSINQLVATINDHQDGLSAELHKSLSEIANDDVIPCLNFSQSIIDQLNERLDKFEHPEQGNDQLITSKMNRN